MKRALAALLLVSCILSSVAADPPAAKGDGEKAALLLSRIERAAGRLDNAALILRNALEACPSSRDVRFRLAEMLLEKSRLMEESSAADVDAGNMVEAQRKITEARGLASMAAVENEGLAEVAASVQQKLKNVIEKL